MKAILEFNLPEENSEFNTTVKANSLYCIIHDIKDFLRTKYKYEDQEQISVEEMRDKVHELINEYDCSELF